MYEFQLKSVKLLEQRCRGEECFLGNAIPYLVVDLEDGQRNAYKEEDIDQP